MNEELFRSAVMLLMPEIRIMAWPDDDQSPTEELARYLSFSWPHIGEHFCHAGSNFEIQHVEHFVVGNKLHITCYSQIF